MALAGTVVDVHNGKLGSFFVEVQVRHVARALLELWGVFEL